MSDTCPSRVHPCASKRARVPKGYQKQNFHSNGGRREHESGGAPFPGIFTGRARAHFAAHGQHKLCLDSKSLAKKKVCNTSMPCKSQSLYTVQTSPTIKERKTTFTHTECHIVTDVTSPQPNCEFFRLRDLLVIFGQLF